jgi:anti-sigma regulatory factor (Ser/Thr protein kinase)
MESVAMPEGGNLTVTSEKKEDRTVIKVSDTGVGIPDEVMANLFKPFQTTKKGGLGLGLADDPFEEVGAHRESPGALEQPPIPPDSSQLLDLFPEHRSFNSLVP